MELKRVFNHSKLMCWLLAYTSAFQIKIYCRKLWTEQYKSSQNPPSFTYSNIRNDPIKIFLFRSFKYFPSECSYILEC